MRLIVAFASGELSLGQRGQCKSHSQAIVLKPRASGGGGGGGSVAKAPPSLLHAGGRGEHMVLLFGAFAKLLESYAVAATANANLV